jgi:hypothetical protein
LQPLVGEVLRFGYLLHGVQSLKGVPALRDGPLMVRNQAAQRRTYPWRHQQAVPEHMQ